MFNIDTEELDGDFSIVTRTRPPAEEVEADRSDQVLPAKPAVRRKSNFSSRPKAKPPVAVQPRPPKRRRPFKPVENPKAVRRSDLDGRPDPVGGETVEGTLAENTKAEVAETGEVIDVEVISQEAKKVADGLAGKVAARIDAGDTIEGNVFAIEFNEMLDKLGIGEDEGALLPRPILLQIAINTLCYMMPKLERQFHKAPSSSMVNAVNSVITNISNTYKELNQIYKEEALENEAISGIIVPSQKYLLNQTKGQLEQLQADIIERVDALVSEQSERIELIKKVEEIVISHLETMAGHIHDTHRFFLDQVRMHIINRRKVRKR